MASNVSHATRHFPRRAPLWRKVLDALALHRQRSHLAALDDHLLADLGLTRDDALAEASRRAWDVPAHWRA